MDAIGNFMHQKLAERTDILEMAYSKESEDEEHPRRDRFDSSSGDEDAAVAQAKRKSVVATQNVSPSNQLSQRKGKC